MAAKITPRLIELTYEAVLKSYWRKNALRKFLRASHVAESFVSTWGVDESKRELLDRLFQKLQATDKGKAVIFQMASECPGVGPSQPLNNQIKVAIFGFYLTLKSRFSASKMTL